MYSSLSQETTSCLPIPVAPQCMCRRVTVVILSVCVCVCLSVTMKSATYLVYTSKTRCHRVLYGVFKVVALSLHLAMECTCTHTLIAHDAELRRGVEAGEFPEASAVQ